MKLVKSSFEIVRCCKGGYWKNNRTKFINVTRVKNYIFKYKDETN